MAIGQSTVQLNSRRPDPYKGPDTWNLGFYTKYAI